MATQDVTITVTARDGAGLTAQKSITVALTDPPSSARQIGMSANASEWDQRLAEVTRPGITARRIFNQTLPSDGRDGASLIEAAGAAGMTPVVSYKLPSFSRAALDSGTYDAGITAASNYLNGLGVPVYATIWHEPSPDVSGVDFQAIHRRLAPLLKNPNVKVGPILNTWVLDNSSNYPKFDGYVADDLIAQSKSNREALTALVKFEVDKGLGRVGLASVDEVNELTARVRSLEAQLREARKTAPAKKAPVKTAPAKKAPVKKAPRV